MSRLSSAAHSLLMGAVITLSNSVPTQTFSFERRTAVNSEINPLKLQLEKAMYEVVDRSMRRCDQRVLGVADGIEQTEVTHAFVYQALQ